MMEGNAFLPLPQGLRITAIERQETMLVVEVLSERPTACCPLCQEASEEIHSRYQRRLKDLPCAGQPIRLHLSVRKFFCRNPKCKRKIFTERLPTFVEPWAQMTLRLVAAIQAIGLSTSGSLGERLAGRLGITTSWITNLRRIMEFPQAAAGSVTTLGVDDFSFKRGRKFGTILVDLSAHQVIDLLPERSAESASEWLRRHPEIRSVSRDRGKDYATACREGAPQAVAIADRFHIMQNFVEALEPEVARCYKHLRPSSALASEEGRKAASTEEERKRLERLLDKSERFEQVKAFLSRGFSPQEVADLLALPVRTVYRWQEREGCPAHQRQRTEPTERQERYALAHVLRAHGLSCQEIAGRLAIGVRTVQRWLRQQTAPYSQPRRKRRSFFDPYAAYVFSRWQQGERSVGLIWSEIQQQGFKGSIQAVYRFLQSLRQQVSPLPTPGVADRISVKTALWLIARPYENLKVEERADLEELCQISQELAALHRLAQSFGKLVRQREGHRLDEWMGQVASSTFRDIKRFAAGLQRDKEEVLVQMVKMIGSPRNLVQDELGGIPHSTLSKQFA